MARLYGYCRISTMKQNIQRQIENIKTKYPKAVIITEEYTGTTTDRPAWSKLAKQLKEGDTVVFDEVSRMSRNAAEGFALYQDLFQRGVHLVFLKEPHINTDVYRGALDRHIDIAAETGRKAIDKYLTGQGKLLNDLMLDLAREQIELAFQSAQQEVDYLHQRTSEGVQLAPRSRPRSRRRQRPGSGSCPVILRDLCQIPTSCSSSASPGIRTTSTRRNSRKKQSKKVRSWRPPAPERKKQPHNKTVGRSWLLYRVPERESI